MNQCAVKNNIENAFYREQSFYLLKNKEKVKKGAN